MKPTHTNPVEESIQAEPDPCEVCVNGPRTVILQNDSAAEFVFPAVRKIEVFAFTRWLHLGWRDMWRHPLASLAYGVVLALFGALILTVTSEYPYLYTAAVSGFALVAPMLGAGLYEKSRRYERGEPVPWITLSLAWQRNTSALVGFSALCLLAGTLWQVISVFVIAVLYKGGGLKPMAMILEILRNPEHSVVFAVYLGMGAVFAAVVFALTVVSAPMLVDRMNCRLLVGLGTSINAVAENPLPMAVWAFVIMLLVGFGFLTALIGLIVVLPWLGHASFHAYRELVEPATE